MATKTVRRDHATRFKPGQSGNPAGRPKGARAKLTEAFLKALLEDFTAHGKSAIKDAREANPLQYLRLIANLVPKDWLEDLTDGASAVIVVESPYEPVHEMVRSPHALR